MYPTALLLLRLGKTDQSINSLIDYVATLANHIVRTSLSWIDSPKHAALSCAVTGNLRYNQKQPALVSTVESIHAEGKQTCTETP